MNTGKTYLRPETLEEVLEITAAQGVNCRLIAGGTDVMPARFHGNDKASCLIDLGNLGVLKSIERKEDVLIVGALVSIDELSSNPLIHSEFPSVAEAAAAVASPVIRKSATLGGNLLCENRCLFYNQSEWWREAIGYCLKCSGDTCIATGGTKNCFSKFVSDMAVVLISLDAKVEVLTPQGRSCFPLEEVYTNDGLNPRKVNGSAILCSVHIPAANDSRTVFKKLRVRQSLDFTSLTTAVTLHSSGKLKLVLGGVDPGPVTLEKTIGNNLEEVIALAVKKARVVDNDVFSRKYRKEMIQVYLRQTFHELKLKF